MTAVLSLCSGYGGLDHAVEAVCRATTRWVADTDRDATTVLATRYPDAPNVGDITTHDWAGTDADIITAGYPCQPFSTAGRRQGTSDARHIWPHVLGAIRAVRPRLVVLENVAGHLSLGFGQVLGDLAAAGFDAEWTVLHASDIGAPHRRARLFVAAHPNGPGQQRGEGRDGEGGRIVAGPHTGPPAHVDGDRREIEPVGALRHSVWKALRDDTDRRSADHWGRYSGAIERWEHILGRLAPDPLTGRQLNAQFVEWMMGLPAGWVTDLLPNRRALKVLGNGVVPQQAEMALRQLLTHKKATA